MASKYVDIPATVQVIGTVFNHPYLLDDKDKYVLTDEDFVNDFHRIIFGSIYKIHELGSSKITIDAILDFLSTRPKSEAIFIANKGEEWLNKISQISDKGTFNYYYGRVKKMSLLRAYDSYGIDVSELYDPDNILDVKKKQLQEEWLDNSTLEDIVNKIDERIDEIKIQYANDTYQEAVQAGDGIFNLIDQLKSTPEVGLPLYGPFINTVTRGARLGKFYLRSAPTGCGKAIPNNTLIPTPTGLQRVGDIKPGDYLFGQDGKPTKVLKIFPQPEKKEIWKVTFADGRTAECCKDHLWEYIYTTNKGSICKVESLENLYQKAKKEGFKNAGENNYRFSVKVNEPVQYQEKEYSVDPYVFGALLGNGVLNNRDFTISSITSELPSKVAEKLNLTTQKAVSQNHNWVFKIEGYVNLKTTSLLKDYPKLWNVKSENVYIPKEYILGSVEQRRALLQGLMDTNGSIGEKGCVSFTTTSKELRDNVIDLVRSLGMIATYTTDFKTKKNATDACYNINVQCPEENKIELFSLSYKVDRAKKYIDSNNKSEYKRTNAITNIERTGKKSDMTCFTVDNNSHLFLMNDYVVTHNTRSMVADACYIGCNEIFDESFNQWIKNGSSEPTLYITTEQDKSEVQTMMLAFLSCVNEDHILYGRYEGDEEDRVLRAAKVINSSNLYIEELPDFSLQDIENTIKKNLREHNVKYVFLDYIHTSMKIMEEITRRSGGIRIREDNVLFMLSIKLKDICNQYGVFIMSATQLNGQYVDSETPDQNLLRGAKSIADKIDWGSILLPASQTDLESLKVILTNNSFDQPALKLSIYKNRRGKYKGLYLWCKADLGTCRIVPMFATTYNYELIQLNDTTIISNEEGAF